MLRSTMIMISLGLIGGATSGCAVLAPGEGHGGGASSLSDEVDAARADPPQKVRRLDAGYSHPAEESITPSVSVAPAVTPTESVMPMVEQPKPPRHDLHPLYG